MQKKFKSFSNFLNNDPEDMTSKERKRNIHAYLEKGGNPRTEVSKFVKTTLNKPSLKKIENIEQQIDNRVAETMESFPFLVGNQLDGKVQPKNIDSSISKIRDKDGNLIYTNINKK